MKKLKRENVTITGLPFDLREGRRGVDMGTSALRIEGLQSKPEGPGYKVKDKGNIKIAIMEQ